MSTTHKLIKDLTAAVKASTVPQTSAYDTTATVTRIEGNATAWVHIPGGVAETPVKLTIDAKVGDTVQIRVGGGTAWLTGNATAPPTDDTTANKAIQKAAEAAGTATAFVTDTSDGVFVHPKNNDTDGVRITDAIEIIKNALSYFKVWVENSLAKVRVGRDDSGHTIIDSNGMRVYGGDGSVQLANIGYGDTVSNASATTSPYYTMGIRSAGYDAGAYSFVEGIDCAASEQCAYAGGLESVATGTRSYARGQGCQAVGNDQTVIGMWNEPDTNGDYVFIVGNGTDNGDLSNGFMVGWDGHIESGDGFDSSKIPYVQEFNLSNLGFEAGTIGTRGNRTNVLTIANACPSGYTLGGMYITNFSDTSTCMPVLSSNGTYVYLCLYRATANAVSGVSATVAVQWIPTR